VVTAGILVGCVGSPTQLRSDAPRVAPPDVEQVQRPDYKKISSSQPQPPAWVATVPDKKDGLEFLVALSNYNASEVEARTAAVQNAITQFARFTGVEVSNVKNVFKDLYSQLASEVLDPTVTMHSKTGQRSNAAVSRIKPKQWYWETYAVTQGNMNKGIAYKYWVLVTVPEDEYARVQDWKRQQKVKKQRAQKKAEAALKAVVDTDKSQVDAIKTALAHAELTQALRTLQAEWNRLYDEKKRFEKAGVYYRDRAPSIAALQKKLVGELGAIQSSLVIDTGRNQPLRVSPADGRDNVPVWAWVRGDGRYLPLRRMPLLLRDASGKTLASARTHENGKAVFTSVALKEGHYRVLLDVKRPPLSDFDAAVAALAKPSGDLSVSVMGNDLSDVVKATVDGLFILPTVEPLPVKTVIVGPVTYGNTNLANEFSLTVAREIKQSLLRVGDVRVLAPKQRTVERVAQAARTRGIGMDKKTVPLGSAAVQASMDGAEGALVTTYQDAGDKVVISMELRQAGSNRVLAACTKKVNRDVIPAKFDLRSVLASETSLGKSPGSSHGIELEVTSSLGDGQVYTQGDEFSFFVTMDQDAYLLLIYQDASGAMTQILPNRSSGPAFYHAGVFIQVPDQQAGFVWKVQPPFGVERLWAFAIPRPFPALHGSDLRNGMRKLDGGVDKVLRTVRESLARSSVTYGEASTAITTAAR